MRRAQARLTANQQLVFYNLGPGITGADAYAANDTASALRGTTVLVRATDLPEIEERMSTVLELEGGRGGVSEDLLEELAKAAGDGEGFAAIVALHDGDHLGRRID